MGELPLKNKNQLESPASEAFSAAEESIFQVTESPQFAELCLQKELDPIKSVSEPAYWDLVADAVIKQAESQRAGEYDLPAAALKLAGLTPAFLFAEKRLRDHNQDKSDRFNDRHKVSYFNGLIRQFGADFPEVPVSEVRQSLFNTAGIACMDNPNTLASLGQTIRGAQHELAFGQILAKTGHKFRGANVQEDLAGTDYFVEYAGGEMAVDVKASLSEIESLGAQNSAFAIKPPRPGKQPVAVMYSLTLDKEFGDRFLISDTDAERKAPILEEQLREAYSQAAAA